MSFFISFEGLDCVGKSTQIELLKEYLDKKNINYIPTKEPGGTKIGTYISDIVNFTEIDPISETLLLLTQRNLHVKNLITPSLDKGQVVICDRYHDSTIAYQVYGKGVNINLVDNIANELNFPTPNITFVINLPFKIAIQRIYNKKNKDKFEEEGENFFKKVSDGYEKICNINHNRCVKIDGNRDINQISLEIINHFEDFYF